MEESLKSEMLKIGAVCLVLFAILKIVFFSERALTLIAVAFGVVYAFVLPGYILMLRLSKKHDFLVSLIIGSAVSIAIVGISSYYISLLGIHVKYHFPLPLIFILIFWLLPQIKQVISKKKGPD